MPTLVRATTETLVHIETTRPTQFIDITDRIHALVSASGVGCGIVNIQTLHTTTGIVVNEHEPLLLRDFESTLDITAPIGGSYRHDDSTVRTVNVMPDERANGHAHCRALLIGASASLNVVDGALRLGRWQRVFFAELDGPRERVVSVVILGEPRSCE
jgi:secondary thiamine-phosphate synthase enzyme